ncbi:MAG: RluA family pseudouridine synthase [Kiritimatiellae bacterium]|nr:RluA family pseudouridine synthase [Kiritimatiellia bacterium]
MTRTVSSLPILYQDEFLLVVSKPSGLLSVPGRGPENQDCVVNRVRDALSDCLEQPAVHRLDMDTSGLLVLALTRDAHRGLSFAFEHRRVAKMYVALLDGVLREPGGTMTLKTRLDITRRPLQIVDPIHGKCGITHWENAGVEGGFTRVLFHPLTGRTHQLRLHAAHPEGLGIPIVGDRLYGTGRNPGELRLHAAHLAFHHPISGEPLTFYVPPSF